MASLALAGFVGGGGASKTAAMGVYGGGILIGGVAAGLLTWWGEEEVKSFIDEYAWAMPLMGGLAAMGLIGFFGRGMLS